MKCHRCKGTADFLHASPRHLLSGYIARPICGICHAKHRKKRKIISKPRIIEKHEIHNYLGMVSDFLKVITFLVVLILIAGSLTGFFAVQVGLFVLSFLIAILTLQIMGWASYFRTVSLVKEDLK